MSENNYYHTVYDPVTKSNIQVPFTEEEILARIAQENENKILLEQEEWIKFRRERNNKLLMCDWTQLPNAPLTEEKKAEWEVYRQALRDLPANITDILNVSWPIPPA